MNNMRRGFTMIELIFVIVIIGILAAVAIPKLAETSTEAKKAIVTSFVGTLNRTVGPSMYASALGGGQADGDVTSAGAGICANAVDYTNFPTGITMDADCAVTVDATQVTTATVTFTNGTATEAPSWSNVFP